MLPVSLLENPNGTSHSRNTPFPRVANSTRFTGVAPKARIRVYKVVGRFIGSISTDVLIKAHIKAYEDGADIISTSIGDERGWPFGAWEITCERIAQKGVIVINSAGNSGRSGVQLISGASTVEVFQFRSKQMFTDTN